MSSTKSPARPAPATDRRAGLTLLLVGHGPAGPARESVLNRHADALRRSGMVADVGVAALSGGPRFEKVLATLKGSTIVVVPLFMCHGHLTKAAISHAVAKNCETTGHSVRLYPPLGLYPELTELIVQRAEERAAEVGIAPNETTLVFVAHGSPKNFASRWATELHAMRARRSSVFRRVWTAYLDEAPHLAEVLAGLPGPAIVCGLFVENGAHATRDTPDAIRHCGRHDVHYLGAIGGDPAVVALILKLIGDAGIPSNC